jgi:hypothetical protein
MPILTPKKKTVLISYNDCSSVLNHWLHDFFLIHLDIHFVDGQLIDQIGRRIRHFIDQIAQFGRQIGQIDSREVCIQLNKSLG